jgi:hemerythrin
MVELQWQKWFEIGHETIDFEHKVFFSLIHKLQCIVNQCYHNDDIRRVMEEILKYAEFHFTSEENLMTDAAYTTIAAHKDIHRALLKDLRDAIRLFDEGEDNADEIVTFLFNWLLEHTVSEDMQFSKSVKEKNIRDFFKTA